MCHHTSNAVRRNLVFAHLPSHFKCSKTKSGFCACAITFQTQSNIKPRRKYAIFACRITKAIIQTYTQNISYLLLHNLLILFDTLKCFTATQNLETVQRVVRHYDLFSQTVFLKNAMIKSTFFCFSALSSTLR